jgi:hypothetical protein
MRPDRDSARQQSAVETRSRSTQRRASALQILLLLLLLAALAGTVALALARNALQVRLERIRASGAPLDVSEVEWLDRPRGADPLPWFEEVQLLMDQWTEESLDEGAERVYAALEGIEGAEERLSAASGLTEFFYRDLDRDLLDPRQCAELVETYREALALRVRESAEMLALARRVDDCAPVDMRSAFGAHWAARIDTIDLPYGASAELRNALAAAALDSAIRGDAEAAALDLQRMVRLADLFQGSPTLLTVDWRASLLRKALFETLTCAHLLPPGALGPLMELVLSSIRVKEEARFALEGERAWVHAQFEQARRGRGTPPDGFNWPGGSILLGLFADSAEINALDEFQRQLDSLESSWPEARARLGALRLDREPANWWLTREMFEPRSDWGVVPLGTEALCGLVRAALRARDAGAEEGRALASKTPDPFGTGPLRSRLEQDGLLVLWSVSDDGVDDGGSLEDEYDQDFLVLVRPAR